MLSPAILYTTAALMAIVAIACTTLCLVWTNPAWRPWLAPADNVVAVRTPRTDDLSGWYAFVGSSLVSAGIAACALVAWYGFYCTLNAICPSL